MTSEALLLLLLFTNIVAICRLIQKQKTLKVRICGAFQTSMCLSSRPCCCVKSNLQQQILLSFRYEEPTAEEGAYARAKSWQSGDSMHSARSSDDGEVSTADGEASSAPHTDKRQKFAERRKDHYDMRNVLQK